MTGPLRECHVISVSRQYFVRIFLSCFLYKTEEARLHRLSVDDELSAKYLVSTVLRVNLRKTEDFRVGQRTSVLFLNLVEVRYLILRERKTLFLIILLNVVNMFDRPARGPL